MRREGGSEEGWFGEGLEREREGNGLGCVREEWGEQREGKGEKRKEGEAGLVGEQKGEERKPRGDRRGEAEGGGERGRGKKKKVREENQTEELEVVGDKSKILRKRRT